MSQGTLESRISAAAARNDELLSTLSSTDGATTAVRHQTQLIADLEAELAELNRNINTLTKKRESELKDHNKYQHSFFRKHAHTVFGKKEKFIATAEKEEKEYFEALREETLAKEQKDGLIKQIEDLQRVLKEELEPVAKRHEEAQKALDELYDQLFDGPTPSFPEEDALEQKASTTLDAYTGIRDRLLGEDAARQKLDEAGKAMGQALRNIEDALDASTWDTWGGGTWADMMERDSLAQTQGYVSKVHQCVAMAIRTSPEVTPLPNMTITSGHVMSDMVFDSIFTDLAQHDRIENSKVELRRGAVHLEAQIKASQSRVEGLKADLARAGEELGKARKELQECRMRSFQVVLKGGQLPAYTA
ncbi:hypothetical protein BD324DRAFT_648824 [Kockovaella imperatae]|uniref:Uncharacterized protein n=1 Tax=Kockovaella imperatae TaxID=4999 RepID=A0A1Y1UQB3_9TREE|nr:hypothetical protein BD324DRAFT_648824 [Kockovaella imperatae]ORX40231.1 hypothetical protein BD324DRAFT_648824 [Kockovaella imperatae]